MSITLFGSCRINNVMGNNNINNKTTYTHSTKEVLQLINFLLGQKTFEMPLNMLCFRTGIIENRPVLYEEALTSDFIKSTIVIVEICSDKTWVYDTHYLHHICVDKSLPLWNVNTPIQVLNAYKVTIQTPEEIEKDILKIKEMIEPRKIVLVTYYNTIINGCQPRNKLIFLLNSIAKKYNINIVNPSEVLKDYTQEEVMKDDYAHYTDFGKRKMLDYLEKYISEI